MTDAPKGSGYAYAPLGVNQQSDDAMAHALVARADWQGVWGWVAQALGQTGDRV